MFFFHTPFSLPTIIIILENNLSYSIFCLKSHSLSGAYRGPAHNHCNLQYSIHPKSWKLPVIFHNLKNYDSKFIINAARVEHGPIRVIPTNMEKFLAFSIGRIQFLDSYQFTQQPLEKLAKTLKDEDYKYLKKEFPVREQFNLLTKKGNTSHFRLFQQSTLT